MTPLVNGRVSDEFHYLAGGSPINSALTLAQKKKKKTLVKTNLSEINIMPML